MAIETTSEVFAHPLNDLVRRGFGCRTFLYKHIHAGRLKAIKMGARTVVLESDLQAWLASMPAYQQPQRQKKRRRRRQQHDAGVEA